MASPSPNVVSLPRVPSLSWDDCRLLVESVVDYAIFMLDVEGRVATWNRGAEKIKGYTASEIVGQHFSKFFPPEDVAAGKPEKELALARETGRTEEEGWRVRKDGSRFWANVVITALHDETGNLRGFGKVTRDLTARRAVAEALRQSEQRFHDLVDAVTDYAIFMLDDSGHVSTWNTGARRLKGYGADEIVGQHFSIFYTPEDRAARKPERILHAVRSEGRVEDEGWRVRKDGTRFWANVVMTALRDDQGKLIGVAKVTRDLTARKASEEAERRLLEYFSLSKRLEMVLEGVSDGITVQDRSGKVVFANSAAAKICGFDSVDELLATPPAEIVARFEMLDEHDQPFDYTRLPGRRVLAGESLASEVLHVRERATGRDWWAFVRANAVFGGDGKPELAINIWHDVSAERHREWFTKHLANATAALGTSLDLDEMFSTLAAVLVPGLADWSSIYLLSDGSLRGVAVAHADPAKLAYAKDYQAKFPPDPSQPRGLWQVAKTGRSEVYNDINDEVLVAAARTPQHLEVLRGAGMKAVLMAPIRDRNEIRGVITLVSAESGRRFDAQYVELAEELGRRAGIAIDNAQLYRAAQESAQAAERASRAKDEFLATVSHELRTPLNAIVGWATLLKGRVADATIAKPIEVIYRNAQAQVRIIDDILDVSRVVTGKFELEWKPADLVSIAREAVEVVRQAAVAKEIAIELVPESDLCLLVADPVRLQQAVWNLLSNSVKFTGAGGKIRIAIRQQGSHFILAVSDTGMGIDPDFLPRVFERFQQADSSTTRRVGGLGLGLALVRHIVELHGGSVEAASEGIGKGATFTLTLPVRAVIPQFAAESAPVPRNRGESQPPAILSGVRVLVVDDDPDALELVSAVLVTRGAEVESALSAHEGFEAFQRVRPDVLVSDISMPKEDGYSFLRRIRALTSGGGGMVPALALTAFAREEDRTRAINAGFTTHIGKPVDPEALACAVANLARVSRRARS